MTILKSRGVYILLTKMEVVMLGVSKERNGSDKVDDS